ncbi:MAG: UV DNA damage repair endonuclease UvsE [Isosphaeraceae bacterium]
MARRSGVQSGSGRDEKPSDRPRLGLCCLLLDEPDVRFRAATARGLGKLSADVRRTRLLDLSYENFTALVAAIRACGRLGIRAFRVMSGLLPLSTHPDYLYGLSDLRPETLDLVGEASNLAREQSIRLSFHPDQFVLLGSPREDVTTAALRDLEQHAELAEALGADAITIHGGGAYGDKPGALGRVARTLDRLSVRARTRLTIENDDKVFHVCDLLPLCRSSGLPLTYDVHHHRCLPDGLSVAEATRLALATWNREPLFHVSSPKEGWGASQPWRHADYIRRTDFPDEWLGLQLTVDVEAKAKERAVLQLERELRP